MARIDYTSRGRFYFSNRWIGSDSHWPRPNWGEFAIPVYRYLPLSPRGSTGKTFVLLNSH